MDEILEQATGGFAAGRLLKKWHVDDLNHGLHEHSLKLGSLTRG